MKRIKTLAVAVLAAVSLVAMEGTSLAAEADTIAVRGVAQQEVAPDMAYVTLGININADTVEEARYQAAETNKKVRRTLLGLAITENNIQSSSYNLYPNYENINGKNKQRGYTLNTTLKIKVDDLKKLGEVIDKTVQEGVTGVSQVNFALSEQSNVQRQLLAAAVDNARTKATIVANAGGRKLGEMLSADINDYSGETIIIDAAARYKSPALGANEVATQLLPGTLRINANVALTFRLN